MVFRNGVNKPGLIEGGGDEAGLEVLIKHVLQEQEREDGIQVVVPLTSTDLERLMKTKKPASHRPVEEGGDLPMIRIHHLELYGTTDHPPSV